MDWIAPINALLLKAWAHVEWCIGAEILAPACRPFWTWSIAVLLGAVGLALLWIGFKLISYQMKLAAAAKAEAERARIADADTMRAHEWDGDKAYQTSLPADDVERRIKEALVARRNEGRPPPVV